MAEIALARTSFFLTRKLIPPSKTCALALICSHNIILCVSFILRVSQTAWRSPGKKMWNSLENLHFSCRLPAKTAEADALSRTENLVVYNSNS